MDYVGADWPSPAVSCEDLLRINLFAVAMRNDIHAGDLKQTLFAYPTHASNLPYML